jgi:beta-phosphoglucomutase-like phosphatase (HAD superfamily)
MASICVIFDLDGTLVDSEGLCNQDFLDLLPQLSDTAESLIQRYRGKKLAQIVAVRIKFNGFMPRQCVVVED